MTREQGADAGMVLLLDDDQDLLDSLEDLIGIIDGRRCLGLRSLAELMAHRERALTCDLAIVDINLGPGQPSGLDAYAWLRAEHFAGRIVFLTGHAQGHPMVQRACTLEGAQAFRKPLHLDHLRALLTRTRLQTRRS